MQPTNEKDLYRTVMNAPIGICLLDAATLNAEIVNDKFLEVAGKPYEAIIGRFYWDAFAEARFYYEAALRGVVETGEPYHADEIELMLIRHGKPEMVFVTFVYSPVKNDAGQTTKVAVWVLENTKQVTERRQVETARAQVQKERDRMNRFFMQAPAGICILDGPELVFELVNPSYQHLFPARELLGKPLLEAVPEVRDQPMWEAIQNVYQTGKTYEGNELLIPLARTNDGIVENRYFNFIYQARVGDNGRTDGILVFVIEVTDAVILRKEAGAERQMAEEKSARLAAIIESSDDAIVSKTQESVITSWNDSAQRMFGYSAAEMIGESIYKLIPEDRLEEEPQILARLRSGERVHHFETKRRRKDGSLLDVSVTVSPVKDSQGNIIGLSKIARDITERKQDEARKNDFIGMVSHELKTPLTSLIAILQVVMAKLKKTEDAFVPSALEKANRQAKKMSNMINGFLNISRLESGKIQVDKQPFIIGDLIKEIIEETNLTGPAHIIELRTCDKVVLSADRDKIGSVISNLLSNAVKYSPKGSNIQVDCRNLPHEVRISVTDEGLGIRPEDREKLFDRFYRAESNHPAYISGFGIGLYLSAEIVQCHHGKIWVESETGKGSTFYFSLPLKG
jgi:PAS domain S-box-containing protein